MPVVFVPALTPAEWSAYLAALTGAHRMRIDAHLLDIDGRELTDMSGLILDGQVDGDAARVIRRSAQATILDPDYQLGLDARSAEVAQTPISRMVRLWHSIRVPALDRWVSIPVFTGPLITTNRVHGGAAVQLTLVDKTHLYAQKRYNPGAWWPKGMRKTDVIRSCATTVVGDTQIAIPDLPDVTVWDHRLEQHDWVPWTLMWVMATSLGMRLYFDGNGTLRLEPWNHAPAFTITDGAAGALLSEPAVTSDWSERATTVRVTGAEASPGVPLVGIAALPADHPMSAARNAVGGVPWDVMAEVEDNALTTQADVDARAASELAALEGAQNTVTFETMPLPFLDCDDLLLVATQRQSTWFRLPRFSLPLNPSGQQTYSYQRLMTRRG